MNDIDDRTKEFYRLREELDNLVNKNINIQQKNVSEYDESKKNLLVRRINELSL